ncbi:hypothetical protein [Acetobacter malorum]|uniref:hypothetical protein n=1 Tax=Acetobacter malorum TaxID=178901 RepID=UPI0039ECDCEB
MSGPESWLYNAAQCFKQFEFSKDLLEQDNDKDFWRPPLVKYGQVDLSSGTVTAFAEPDAKFIMQIADYIRNKNDKIKRGANKKDVAEHIACEIRRIHNKLKSKKECTEILPSIEDGVEKWFEYNAQTIVHYIPCIIMPDYADQFSIGPITFTHIHDILKGSHNLPYRLLPKSHYDALCRALNDSSAAWVAIVEVTKCLEDRSLELANLAVDVAIGALKIVVTKTNNGSGMARATARTLSKWKGSLAGYTSEFSKGPAQRTLGILLDGHKFNEVIIKNKLFISNVGISLNAFLSGQDQLRNLRQAWCDSAYWYHEGTAEPLATVAVVKLETAIESLLRTSSSKGSEDRIKSIIQKITGLKKTDIIPEPIGKSVEKYAKYLVSARSRILHGTLSALMDDTGEERDHLIWLARKLLLTCGNAIEDFSTDGDASDNIEKFLEWLEKRQTL